MLTFLQSCTSLTPVTSFTRPAGAGGDGLVEGQPGAMSARGGGNPGGGGGGGGGAQMIKHVTNDAREDEMDANLGAVSDILGKCGMHYRQHSCEPDYTLCLLSRVFRLPPPSLSLSVANPF